MPLAMLREAHGLTQIDVAAKLGVDQGAISKRERAGRRVLVENLEAYAHALGCECEVVFNSRLGHRFVIDFDGDSILITNTSSDRRRTRKIRPLT